MDIMNMNGMKNCFLLASLLLPVYLSCTTAVYFSCENTRTRATKAVQAAKSSHFLLALLDMRPYASGERDAPEDLVKVKALLNRGADVNITASDGFTPLLLASEGKRHDTTLLLIARGAKVNVHSGRGVTPLMLAAYFDYADIVRYLLDKNAIINAQDYEGQTALIRAAEHGSEGAVQILLEHGADATLANKYGVTALQTAQDGDHSAVEKLILKALSR